MDVIGFFRVLFDQFGDLVMFVTSPLGQMFPTLEAVPLLKDWSVIGIFGYGLLSMLGLFLITHLIRLFIGG